MEQPPNSLVGASEFDERDAVAEVDLEAVQHRARDPGSQRALRVVRGGEAGAEIPLKGSRIVAGRRADCAVTLHDPSVSRQHAAFENRAGIWWVIDLDSTNGTKVNGRPVSKQLLKAGDRVELGETVIEFIDTDG